MFFQIFLILFALFAIFKVSRQYQRRRVSVHWFVVWTIFWLVVIAVAILPQATDVVARYVGVERGADLLVYTAVVLLVYAMYRVFVRLERHDRELTELVRALSIEERRNKDNER